MNQRLRNTIALLCLPTLLLLSGPGSTAEFDRIGNFDFPTSASGEAEEHFLLGVGYLHSFGFVQAQREFRRAQELDPDFAMAYWGEVFTYQHPFFGGPSDGPADALMRLGRTSEERLAKAPNDLEKGFLRAAEAYALTPGSMADRRTAWMEAMAEVYENYPEHDEVKAFYTVAMLAGATSAGELRERINMQAGALGLELFKKNDNHPGAAHYVIHAFDDPVHAPIALEAAWKYADIAPAVSHARHMPTHIFIQRGMWEQVSKWNDSAYQVAAELWQAGDAADPQNHAADWGQYGDLQLADLERSRQWIERAEKTLSENPDHSRSRNTLGTMQARHTIESEQWQTHELSAGLNDDQLLALGLSAANLGELELATEVAQRLEDRASDNPNDSGLQIMYREVAGITLLREASSDEGRGNRRQREAKIDQGLGLLVEAAELADTGPLPRGAAMPLKPAHELAGEALLAHGQAEQAAEMFEASLLRTPNRPRSLLGAARAYRALGEEQLAAERYRALHAIWEDSDHSAVSEARNFLGSR